VNAAFEHLTGYTRSEVIGKNCNFLQYQHGKRTHQNSLKSRRMGNALQNRKRLKVIVENYRKNGDKFFNLLVMKPILDQFGNYRYVVGLQCEMLSDEILFIDGRDVTLQTSRSVRLHERLIQIIPDILNVPKKLI
jgi:PAS domain S-box-containing protein